MMDRFGLQNPQPVQHQRLGLSVIVGVELGSTVCTFLQFVGEGEIDGGTQWSV